MVAWTRIAMAAAILLAMGVGAASAAPRVANYSTGTPGTASFEQLSFWVSADNRTRVVYSYGVNRREQPLRQLPSPRGTLRVRFGNGATLRIRRSGQQIRVVGIRFPYDKAFRWHYEGPVNGVGTACTVCVARARAMGFVQTRFLGGRR